MFKAYFDDSTSNQDLREFVVAGYVQTTAVWERFTGDWQAALDASPAIRWFHMVEAESLRGEFKGWTVTARDAKVAAMADVIETHALWSISCHLKLSQFDAIVGPVVPHDLRHPYYFCLNAITSSLVRWHAAKDWKEPIDFVFAEHLGNV